MVETYKVTLAEPSAIPGQQRIRAGVVVTKQDGYEGVLSSEQVEAIKADPQLRISKVEADKPAAKKSAKK